MLIQGFCILVATIVDDLGFSTVCVASAFCILIQGFCILAGHAAMFSPLTLAILDEMLAYLAVTVLDEILSHL